jgi:hypothetical protein
MYLPLINVGYILFTACMTLAGMLASDPEGALFFVSTLPLPFASSVMLLAPALVQIQLKYVLQLLEFYGNFKRTIIKASSFGLSRCHNQHLDSIAEIDTSKDLQDPTISNCHGGYCT